MYSKRGLSPVLDEELIEIALGPFQPLRGALKGGRPNCYAISEPLIGSSPGSIAGFYRSQGGRIYIEILWCPEEDLNLHDLAITST